MSRSIHETAAAFRRLVESDEPRPVMRDEARRLRDKHRIKRAVRRARRTAHAPPAPPAFGTLPVRVADQGAHVHHGASPEDVREVLRRLPPGTVDGLAAVNLRLGYSESLRQARRAPAGERPDPYTGRPGFDLGDGVWGGRVLGLYRQRRSTIEVYAFVVADRDPDFWPFWEWELRVRALRTLAHEAAHHHDATCRVARGRWRAGPGPRAEAYAMDRARAWTAEIVKPYLAERYPDALERFREFVPWDAED